LQRRHGPTVRLNAGRTPARHRRDGGAIVTMSSTRRGAWARTPHYPEETPVSPHLCGRLLDGCDAGHQFSVSVGRRTSGRRGAPRSRRRRAACRRTRVAGPRPRAMTRTSGRSVFPATSSRAARISATPATAGATGRLLPRNQRHLQPSRYAEDVELGHPECLGLQPVQGVPGR
jgi:hypothetical protein